MDIASNNGPQILSLLNSTVPDGGTPTHTTLDAALDYFAATVENPAGRFILLATDGLPNCNPTDSDDSSQESIAAVAALSALGVGTFVLGFGSEQIADTKTLAAMANAGGTGDFFPANSPDELAAALDAIAGAIEVAPCSYALDAVAPNPGEIRVLLDGDEIARGPDGFDYDAGTNSVVLLGDSCSRVQGGDVEEVAVDYGCYIPECEADGDCPTGEFCETGLCRRPIVVE